MVRNRILNIFRVCVSLDTMCPTGFSPSPRRRRGGRIRHAVVAAVVVSASIATLSCRASVAPIARGPIDARVVWQRNDRVYVALGDSSAVASGDTLLFHAGTKLVAAAPIVSIAEGGLAVARIVSGTLAHERRLDRLRVLAARVPLPSPSMLRVGFPSVRRAALRFGCGQSALRPPLGMAYRVEPIGRLGYRLTRDSSDQVPRLSPSPTAAGAPAASWPDTILASLFEDAADEEIAFERGDLDVALFGPDELPARVRESPRGQSRLFVGRDVLTPEVADPSASPAPSDSRAFCPLLVEPELLPYVRTLGASAFLGMIDCDAATGRP